MKSGYAWIDLNIVQKSYSAYHIPSYDPKVKVTGLDFNISKKKKNALKFFSSN